MAEYYLTPEAIKVSHRALIKRVLLVAAIMLVGGLCYDYWVLHSDMMLRLFMVVAVIGANIYSYFHNLKQQKLAVESYRLLLDADSISRFSAIMPTIKLSAAEITSITQHTQGIIVIATADKYRSIYVPAQVTNRAELLHELERFAPLTAARKNWAAKVMPLVSGIGTLCLMVLFYSVNNKIVSTITGTILLGILSWSYWHIWRNKSLPKLSRRLLWFMPLVLFSIVAGIIARLLQ